MDSTHPWLIINLICIDFFRGQSSSWQGETGPEAGRNIKLFIFFHGKTFTPTPVTLEIKTKEVLNTYFGALRGLWRTKSARLY